MLLEGFGESVSVRYWLDGLKNNAGPHSTSYHWVRHLKRFCDWVGKNPDQLIEERKQQLKSDDQRVQHAAEMSLKRYLDHLQEVGLAPNTRKTHFMAVRNFYKRNYCELTFFRGDGPGGETTQEGTRAASKEDIRRMAEVVHPRVRALILFLKDTGLAESDAAVLKLKDLKVFEASDVRPLKEVSEIFTLEPPVPVIIRRQKTKRRTITFVGKESLEALKTTLRVRQQGSPELQMRRYGRVEPRLGLQPESLTLESPLFRSYEKFFAKKNLPIHHLSPHAISVLVRKAAIQAGVWKEGFSAHALRRYFQTALETAGTNQNWVKKMMGHALEGSEAPYSQPEVSVLREAYARAYSHVAVSEVAEQKSRVEQLEAQVAALQMNGASKKHAIDEMQERFEAIQSSGLAIEALLKRVRELEKKLTK